MTSKIDNIRQLNTLEIINKEGRLEQIEKKILKKVASKLKKQNFVFDGETLGRASKLGKEYLSLRVFKIGEKTFLTPVAFMYIDEIEYLYNKVLPVQYQRADVALNYDNTIAITYFNAYPLLGEETPAALKWNYEFDRDIDANVESQNIINFFTNFVQKIFTNFEEIKSIQKYLVANEHFGLDMLGYAATEKRMIFSALIEPKELRNECQLMHSINIVKLNSGIKDKETGFNPLFEFERFIYYFQKMLDMLLMQEFMTFTNNPVNNELERVGKLKELFDQKYTLVSNLNDKLYLKEVKNLILAKLSKKGYEEKFSSEEYTKEFPDRYQSISPKFYSTEEGIRVDVICKIYYKDIITLLDGAHRFFYKQPLNSNLHSVDVSISEICTVLDKKEKPEIVSKDASQAASQFLSLVSSYCMPFFKKFAKSKDAYELISLNGTIQNKLQSNLYYRFITPESIKRHIHCVAIAAINDFSNFKEIASDWHSVLVSDYYKNLINTGDGLTAKVLIDYEYTIAYVQNNVLKKQVFTNFILNK